MRQPDPLLLELFESVHKDLSSALETRQRLSKDSISEDDNILVLQTERIAQLKAVIAELEAALERPYSRLVH